MKEKKWNQIIRKDGKGRFVEVLMDGFDIEKVHLKFVNYNMQGESGSRITGEVDIYLAIDKFLQLEHDLFEADRRLAYVLACKAKEAAKDGKKALDPVTVYLGGVPEKMAAARGIRHDGKALSRSLKILAGDRKPFVFVAESGPGRSEGPGIIVPDGKPEISVVLGLSAEDAKGLFLTTKLFVEAWAASEFSQRMAHARAGWEENRKDGYR